MNRFYEVIIFLALCALVWLPDHRLPVLATIAFALTFLCVRYLVRQAAKDTAVTREVARGRHRQEVLYRSNGGES